VSAGPRAARYGCEPFPHALVGIRLQVGAPEPERCVHPRRGFASSANDLGSLFRAMLAPGRRAGRPSGLLSEQAVKDLFEPVIAEEPGFAEFSPRSMNTPASTTPPAGACINTTA